MDINSCRGHRSGPLCGDCAAGFTEALGSSDCVSVAHCDSDKRVVYAVMIAGVFLAAGFLLVASGVWLPSTSSDSGIPQLLVYYFQARATLHRFFIFFFCR